MIKRDIAILLLTCLGLLGPFVGKPVHMDDPLFIWTARQIVIHPLDFYGFDLNWSGHREPMHFATMNPPLQPYYLAMVGRTFGWDEITLHLAMLPISFLCVLGMYFLSRHFCRSPLVATLLMVFCPAFLVSATTLMCEVPMMCLWLWAIVAWMRGSVHSPWWLIVSGCLIGIASLTKYQAVCIIPLMIAHAVLFPRTIRVRVFQVFSLLIPALMLAAYDDYTAIHYGHGMFSSAFGFSSDYARQHGSSAAAKLLDALIFVGGGAVAPILLGWLALPARWRWFCALNIPAMVWVAGRLIQAPGGWNSSWPFNVQAGILAAAGVVAAIVCARQMTLKIPESCDVIFLLIWALGVYAFAGKLNWSVNARTILPLVPPVCILVQRAIEQQEQKSNRVYVFAGSLAAMFAVLLTLADYESAVANRWAAKRLMLGRSNAMVWFTGHWGFQYYLQELGATPLEEERPAYHPRDTVIVPLNNYSQPPRGLNYEDSLTVDTFPWLSTVDSTMGANFYFSPGDRLPFVFGSIPSDNFVIFRVPGR